MTDNEIIKALECWSSGKECEETCECFKYDTPRCDLLTAKSAIELINRQKAEIERLRGERKQRKGEWIDVGEYYGCQQSYCSVCGKASGIKGIDVIRHKAFCPNCGAEMRGKRVRSSESVNVEVGATYRHFKGHIVKVLAVAKDTESVTECAVVYEHLGTGVVWYRPYDMFTSEVDHEKYPEVLQKYRFEKVEE